MEEPGKFCDLGFAKVDLGRKIRRGFPEVIYSPGKTRQQLKKIAYTLIKNKQDVLFTRMEEDVFYRLKKSLPRLRYNKAARLGYLRSKKPVLSKGIVVVVSAGTSDMPVAEEASVTLEIMGSRVARIYDAGVAGVHRLMHNLELLRKAKVIVVVAGMEGALASLVSGMVSCPVVAVPTSFGYGANFSGLSALLTMLNSCSAGVAVMNIDNGFGAGYFASLINK